MDLHDRSNPDVPPRWDPTPAGPNADSPHAAPHVPDRAEITRRNEATLDLLRRWSKEDATSDLMELKRRQTALDEFKQGMNTSSSSGRKVFP